MQGKYIALIPAYQPAELLVELMRLGAFARNLCRTDMAIPTVESIVQGGWILTQRPTP